MQPPPTSCLGAALHPTSCSGAAPSLLIKMHGLILHPHQYHSKHATSHACNNFHTTPKYQSHSTMIPHAPHRNSSCTTSKQLAPPPCCPTAPLHRRSTRHRNKNTSDTTPKNHIGIKQISQSHLWILLTSGASWYLLYGIFWKTAIKKCNGKSGLHTDIGQVSTQAPLCIIHKLCIQLCPLIVSWYLDTLKNKK